MLETMRRLGTATSSLHRGMKDTVDTLGALLVDAFIISPCSQSALRPSGPRLQLSSEWSPKVRRASETSSSCSSILKLERWSAFISKPRASRYDT